MSRSRARVSGLPRLVRNSAHACLPMGEHPASFSNPFVGAFHRQILAHDKGRDGKGGKTMPWRFARRGLLVLLDLPDKERRAVFLIVKRRNLENDGIARRRSSEAGSSPREPSRRGPPQKAGKSPPPYQRLRSPSRVRSWSRPRPPAELKKVVAAPLDQALLVGDGDSGWQDADKLAEALLGTAFGGLEAQLPGGQQNCPAARRGKPGTRARSHPGQQRQAPEPKPRQSRRPQYSIGGSNVRRASTAPPFWKPRSCRDYELIRLTRGYAHVKPITAWDKLKKSCL